MDYDPDDAGSLKSDGTNYLLWSYMMRFEIEGELWDYVSGLATRPDPKNKKYLNLIKHWESMNATALSIIDLYVDRSLSLIINFHCTIISDDISYFHYQALNQSPSLASTLVPRFAFCLIR